MENINSVSVYGNAADLIAENITEETDISDSVMDYIRHVLDYETTNFMLVDDSTVISFDIVSGTVYSTDSLKDFIANAIAAALEK